MFNKRSPNPITKNNTILAKIPTTTYSNIFFFSLFVNAEPYSLNKLKYGLNKEEVVNNVFGSKPFEKKIVDSSKEIYVYYIHSSLFELFLNKEKFPYIGFYPLNRTGREYWLLFDNKEGLIKSAYAKEWNILKQNNISLHTMPY